MTSSQCMCVRILTKMTPSLSVHVFVFVCAFVWGMFWVPTVSEVLHYKPQVPLHIHETCTASPRLGLV